MNIAGLCYRVATGIDQTACTLIGQQIGSGNVKEALNYYFILKIFAAITMLLVCIFQFTFSE
jgi:Na+-driven multidrug efflux pump